MSTLTDALVKCVRFTLTLGGVSEMNDEIQGRILKVGCDDSSLWSEGATVFLSFDREADSLGNAIGTAVADVERAGLAVARIDVDSA